MEDAVAHELVPVRLAAGDLGDSTADRRPPWRFDAVKRETYVNLIRQGYRRHRAAELVGVSYRCVLDTIHSDPDFADAVSEAEMAKIDEVEEALYETAIAGNVTAQQVILFNRRPEQWTDTRTMRAREELARQAAEDGRATDDAPPPLEGLRTRMLEMRERLIEREEVEA